ncbi:MAG TPA: hypothetical protein PLN40_14795, partial [Agitococcus sp.]|nr:hypothetical protein [Agitococcus sp.]
ISQTVLDIVDDIAVSQHLFSQLPVKDVLSWLQQHYGYLSDSTLLRLYHYLIQQEAWLCFQAEQAVLCELKQINVYHYPHGVASH